MLTEEEEEEMSEIQNNLLHKFQLCIAVFDNVNYPNFGLQKKKK